jgi:hypothetical protein
VRASGAAERRDRAGQTLFAARIVGRAAAPETGHYLLADPGAA